MNSDYVITQHGVDYVVYAGLLAEAHLAGVQLIRSEPLQLPTPENGYHAICHARVIVARGTFTALGEASPRNASRSDPSTMLHLADIRAKAHALCDALNVHLTPIEDWPAYVPAWRRLP